MEEVNGKDVEKEKESFGSSDLPIYNDGKSNGVADLNHKPLIVDGTVKTWIGRARRSSKANWTEEEDAVLQDAVQRYEGKCWKKIAELLPGRTDVQCLHRWQKVLKPDLVKGPWTKEEDNLLIELVGKFGKKWSEIEQHLPGRIGKQCRERWSNHLNPEINKAAWTKEEEVILIDAHAEHGNRWCEIARLLPGRTENSVKNHWNCSLKKKLDNYLASSSTLNRPRLTITPGAALNSNKTETGAKFVEAKQNPSTNSLRETTLDSGNNGQSCCLNLTLGYSGYSSIHSSGKGNNPARPSPSTCSEINQSRSMNQSSSRKPEVLDEVDSGQGTNGHSHKPRLISSTPQETSSTYLPPYLNSPQDPSCDDRNFITSLRSAAMSYDNVPSIIRKRAIQTLRKDCSTSKPVGSLNRRTLEMHESPKVDDDRVQILSKPVLFSPKYQKLENFAAIESVGKCLERAFSDA